jgi:hypothetical protein
MSNQIEKKTKTNSPAPVIDKWSAMSKSAGGNRRFSPFFWRKLTGSLW